MALARNFSGLLATRFFLGLFEATVAPTFVTIVTIWYRRIEQGNRNAIWYSQNGFTNICRRLPGCTSTRLSHLTPSCLVVGPLLTYGLGHIHSSTLKSYQIIFLFTGLLTVVASIFVFLLLPDNPTKSRFLSTEEKVIAVERLRANQQGMETKHWKWKQVRECLIDPKTYLWMTLSCLVSCVFVVL
jgi:MFS family permease